MTSNPSSERSPRRLLAVDDNRIILEVIEDHFVAMGWEVWRAEDGARGLQVLERGVPDAVVADILMPVLDGWGFYSAVRARPATREIPFVFLTIESDLPQRLRGLRLGADDYVVKPFDVEDLYLRIENLLARRRPQSVTHEDSVLLSGSVKHFALSDLLQILALNGKDGIVEIVEGSRQGRIEFDAGQLVHAVSETSVGVKALHRMLGWAGATFRVLPREGPPRQRTLEGAPSTLLMDGLVALDEWRRRAPELPSTDARLEIVADARARLTGRQVSGAEFEVLSRIKRGATVGQIFDESARDDSELAEAIATLLSEGVISNPIPV